MTCPPPETLSAVFNLAVRANAIDETFGCSTYHQDLEDRHKGAKPAKYTRTLNARGTDDVSPAEATISRTEFRQFQEEQRKLSDELESCRKRFTKAELELASKPESMAAVTTERSAKTDAEVSKPQVRNQSRGVDFDTCRKCRQKGHWARDCPLVVTSGTNSNPSTRTRANLLTASSQLHNRVYIQLVYEGQFYRALLDTGCDVSVIGAHVLPGLTYEPNPQKLYAANESIVPIAGSTELRYKIGSVDMKYEVLVSEAIEEIIFGADWLSDHHCIWDFDKATIYLRDCEQPRPVPLLMTKHRPCVRRIFAKESVEIPPRSQIDIPVKSVWTHMPPTAVNWLVEPREYRTGVLLARTLLSSDGQ